MTSISSLKRRLEQLGCGEGLGNYCVVRWPMRDYEIRSLWIDDGSSTGRFLRFLEHGEVLLGVDQPPWAITRDEVGILHRNKSLWEFSLGKNLSEEAVYGPFLDDPVERSLVGKKDFMMTLLQEEYMNPKKETEV